MALGGLIGGAHADDKRAFFGDLHIHTMYSMDAFMRGVRTSPADAYRFALGEAIPHPNGSHIRLAGPPLDFLAVADHAEFLGIHASFLQPGSPNFDHPVKDYLLEPFSDELAFQTKMKKLRVLAQSDPAIVSPEIIRDAWARTVETANRYNDPGRFTAFIGYEYTSTRKGRHLHRNVIFRGADTPAQPFSSVQSPRPEDLWNWLDQLRADGIETLAIPHNMNQSDGLAFPDRNAAGELIDAAYAERRMRNEPIVEITQLKGTSETHPTLSPNDEWADFQIVQYYLNKIDNTDPISVFRGGYAREALLRGLGMQSERGFNPFEFGFIGSSDSHLSGGSYDEAAYFSKGANTPESRGSHLPAGRESWQDVFTPREGSHGPGGLAGVWARENTRSALFDAMRNRETFATSGPRVQVRLFGSFSWPADLAEGHAPIGEAYNHGVPMGGVLTEAGERAPVFLIWAVRDPRSSWLQRAQIVKGWIEAGQQHERVFDVACADGEKPDLETHRCPKRDGTVNLETCEAAQNVGDVAFRETWVDPEFDPGMHAFYYLRVLENPTCRWSTWDAVRTDTARNPTLPAIQQDRAWSSPIWYAP